MFWLERARKKTEIDTATTLLGRKDLWNGISDHSSSTSACLLVSIAVDVVVVVVAALRITFGADVTSALMHLPIVGLCCCLPTGTAK